MITDYTKLPTLLQSRKHWVLCGVPGAADPKHPRQAKHPQWGADSTNPATWADFATASAAVMLDDADGMETIAGIIGTLPMPCKTRAMSANTR